MEEAAAAYEAGMAAPGKAAGEAARIAGIMGLPKWRQISDMGLVRQIEDGLPLAALESLADFSSPDDRSARFHFISRATYHRLQKQARPRLSKEASERLYAVARVLDQALRLWQGDRPAMTRFLRRPHALLEGRSPYEVASESTAGADLVVRLIGQARAGVAL